MLVELLWKYCQTRNQATEKWRTQILFYAEGTRWAYNRWTPFNEFTGFLKHGAGHQVTRNVLVVNRWASAGLETPGCLDRSSRGGLLWKVCLQKETKEGGNGQLSLHGAFCLGPGLILWLHYQFLLSCSLLETIFLFRSKDEEVTRSLPYFL
jgi:hypothetical protein